MPILFMVYIVLIFIVDKVRDCCFENKTLAAPKQPAPSKPSQPTAADILGLRRQRPTASQAVSLEMEVDQYLSNLETGSGTVTFWQVVLILTPCTLILH
jgi:hypothetical protein